MSNKEHIRFLFVMKLAQGFFGWQGDLKVVNGFTNNTVPNLQNMKKEWEHFSGFNENEPYLFRKNMRNGAELPRC